MPATLQTTCTAMAGATASSSGSGQVTLVDFGGSWAVGEGFSVLATERLSAKSYLFGIGTVTGLQPSYVFTFDDKINVLAGTAWYFSATAAPTTFNDQNAFGLGFIDISNTYGASDDLVAMSPYQGGVAIIARRFVQIWSVDPQAENYQRKQTLMNVGTVAKLSVQPVGDMDVYMLADNGVRSIRVRDASNNAVIADIGTPIDAILKEVMRDLTADQRASACAVVEPSSNRYWLYLPGDYIYVFSYFTSSGIAAWSRYRPTSGIANNELVDYTNISSSEGSRNEWTVTVGKTYFWKSGGNSVLTCGSLSMTDSGFFEATSTTVSIAYTGTPADHLYDVTAASFTPEKFAVLNGRVYVRSGDNIYIFGGLDNATYEQCFPQWDIPFLNAKSPATRKMYHGLDIICEGTWTVRLGTNVADGEELTTIYRNEGSSPMRGKSLAAKAGTHFKLRGIELGSSYARFSSAILHYEGGDAK